MSALAGTATGRVSTEFVEFRHVDAWEGTATWGQESFWDGMRRYAPEGWHRNVACAWELPSGTRVSDALDLVERLVARNSGLRTTLHESAHGLQQRLHGSGGVPVEIAAAGADPAEQARALAQELRLRSLDGPGTLPITAGIVRSDGVASHLVAAVSHLSIDVTSVRVLIAELLRDDVPPAVQPRQQAELEQQARGLRTAAGSVARWVAWARDSPLPYTADSIREDQSEVVQLVLSAPRLARYVDQIAAQLGLTTATVLVASVAVAMGALQGKDRVPIQAVTSNRYTPGTERYVGVLAQLSPFVVPVERVLTFDDVARETSTNALRAYAKARWSPRILDARLREQQLDPDEVLGACLTYNDVRGDFPGVQGRPVVADGHVTVDVLKYWPFHGGRFSVAVTGDADLTQIAGRADTRYCHPAAVREVLLASYAVVQHVAVRDVVSVAELVAVARDAAGIDSVQEVAG